MSYITEAYGDIARNQAFMMARKGKESDLKIANDNLEAACEVINTTRDELAHVLAQRGALMEFIRKLVNDPAIKIPIFDDKDLWERIGKAGVSAFTHTSDWNSAKEAGRTFSIPPVPDPFGSIYSKDKLDEKLNEEITEKLNEKVAEANAIIATVNENLVQAYGKVDAAQAEIREIAEKLGKNEQLVSKLQHDNEVLTMTCAHHMAQAAAFRQQLLEAEPLNPLITDSSLRERLANAAYSQLVANGFTDWKVVKQVGASFVSTNERQRATQVGVVQTESVTDESSEAPAPGNRPGNRG